MNTMLHSFLNAAFLSVTHFFHTKYFYMVNHIFNYHHCCVFSHLFIIASHKIDLFMLHFILRKTLKINNFTFSSKLVRQFS